MKTVTYTCPYIPKEWILAHGLMPVNFHASGSKIDRCCMEGLCAFIRQLISSASMGQIEVLILSTRCDQMRRAYELVSLNKDIKVFLFNVPRTFTDNAYDLYKSELIRLSEFLCTLGGQKPSESRLLQFIKESIKTSRRLEKEAESITNQYDKNKSFEIALAGGPFSDNGKKILEVISNAGGKIAFYSKAAKYQKAVLLEEYIITDDPFEALAKSYFFIPDIIRRPDKAFYDVFARVISSEKPSGIVIYRYLWCDIWASQVERIRTMFDGPVLDIVDEGNGGLNAKMENQIEAFLEIMHR